MTLRDENPKRFLQREDFSRFLARGLAGSTAVRFGAMAASFFVGVELARMLGVEGYGYYGIALSIITLVGIPGELGVSRVVTREVAAATAVHDEARLFGALSWARQAVLSLSLIMAAIAIAGCYVVAASRPSVPAFAVLLGAPVIPLMALARVNAGALQGMHRVVRGQIPANLLRPIFISIGLAGLYVTGVRIGVSTAMALNSVAAALVALIAYVWLQQRLPVRTVADPVRAGRQWLASAIPMAMTDAMSTLQAELSILLVGVIVPAAAVGLFRVAIATASVAAAAVPAVVFVALPVIARLYAEQDRARLQKAVTLFAYCQFGGVLLLSLPLLVMPQLLLSIVFGQQFVGAATALRILAAGQIANAAFGPNAPLLNMTHHERRVTRAMAIAVGVNVLLLPPLVLAAGIVGASAAIFVSILTWNILAWRDAKRLLGVQTSALLRSPWVSQASALGPDFTK